MQNRRILTIGILAAILIAAVAVSATPARVVRAVDTTLTCPLPLYDAGHYALNPGQTVTCTINDAIFIGSPTQLAVYITHPTLGTEVVWGTLSGTTITFTYTGRGNGCDTEDISYSDNDGHLKALSGLRGFGYPGPCGEPTPTQEPGPGPTPTDTPIPPQAFFGCSPGFWKNHLDLWPASYTPGTTEASVFNTAGYPSSIQNATLQQALSFKGGTGVNGGARILLRAGVAALLNAAADIGYPLSTSDVIDQVRTALASHDRATMIDLAGTLNGYNNLPHSNCPSGASGQAAPSSQASTQSNPVLSFLRSLWNAFVARLEPATA